MPCTHTCACWPGNSRETGHDSRWLFGTNPGVDHGCRSAANNCCYALEKSLLMDYVRKVRSNTPAVAPAPLHGPGQACIFRSILSGCARAAGVSRQVEQPGLPAGLWLVRQRGGGRLPAGQVRLRLDVHHHSQRTGALCYAEGCPATVSSHAALPLYCDIMSTRHPSPCKVVEAVVPACASAIATAAEHML
jgi:hypothetical protein